ncbi:MAG: hypothetical protein JNL67_10010 [Planctomycetaceae bacterium]|nr:hypothetical protein [Planctomycetaceae bacterium]
MSLISMRPTFRLRLAGDLKFVQQRLQESLAHPAWKDRGQIFGDYAEFHVAEDEQRYWSPHLAIHLEPVDHQLQIQYRQTDGARLAEAEGQDRGASDPRAGDSNTEVGGTMLVGRFAPRQNVWMLVWIVYLAMAFLIFFALVYASVQYWMNTTPWAISVGLAGIVCILGLHMVSMVGQSWSSDQMHELRARLDELLLETGLEPIDAA